MNNFKYNKWLKTSIRPTDWTLTGTTTPIESGPWFNGKEGVLHIHQRFRTGASPSDGFVSYPGFSLVWSGESQPSVEVQSASFLVKCYMIETEINRYYLLANSTALKHYFQKWNCINMSKKCTYFWIAIYSGFFFLSLQSFNTIEFANK